MTEAQLIKAILKQLTKDRRLTDSSPVEGLVRFLVQRRVIIENDLTRDDVQ